MEINIKMHDSEYTFKTPDETVETSDDFVDFISNVMKGMGWCPTSVCRSLYWQAIQDAQVLNLNLQNDEAN